MMGPRRHFGAPPPVSDRWARAAYFGEWHPRLLPRRGRRRADGRRAYEVRLLMTGLVFGIDDDLSAVGSTDVLGLLDHLQRQERAGTHLGDRFENEALYWSWLRRALLELHARTGDLAPGTPIPEDDLHLQDLEAVRRVAECLAATLFVPLEDDGGGSPQVHQR